MAFKEIKTETINKLMNVEIGEFVVDINSIRAIRDILSLSDRDVAELRDIRNSVVKSFSLLTDTAFENNEYERFFDIRTKLSGITCVIDNEIYNRGGEV